MGYRDNSVLGKISQWISAANIFMSLNQGTSLKDQMEEQIKIQLRHCQKLICKMLKQLMVAQTALETQVSSNQSRLSIVQAYKSVAVVQVGPCFPQLLTLRTTFWRESSVTCYGAPAGGDRSRPLPSSCQLTMTGYLGTFQKKKYVFQKNKIK